MTAWHTCIEYRNCSLLPNGVIIGLGGGVVEGLHLLNTCTQIDTISSEGCDGTEISCCSSLAVGIQNDSLPSSTNVFAANSRISSSIAKKLYGFLGGTKSGDLFN